MSSAGIGAWKPKPSGGMAPGPGGDRPTTYDVFVGNLPEQSDDAELYSLFAKYGEINSTVVLAGKRGDGRQIGFVRFVSESDALSACQDTGHMINGCPITVRRANKKTGGSQSSGGSTGGGDGTGRKMDRRPPTGGYGGGLLDHQTSPVDKPDQGEGTMKLQLARTDVTKWNVQIP
ncbi:hypothetical protein LSAT2_004496 [Lamellibrachia satsuma]|nr:hypothetical protein LSAT2_004496 [Lamellibrachia satsuma]